MKLKLILLFALFQTGLLFSQVEQFDPNYLGAYRSEDDEIYFYIYNLNESGRLDLTEEQRKNAVFIFTYQNRDAVGMSVAMKKGNGYVSVVNEDCPEFLFTFKNLDGVQTIEITEKSGKKIGLTKTVANLYYDDEESDLGYEYIQDEENVSPVLQDEELGDEATDVSVAVRTYVRSDGAELVAVFTEESLTIGLQIPAAKSCSEVLIVDDVVRSGEEGMYIYNDPEGKFVLHLIESESTMQFVCVKGDCFDKKGTCGIWKEIFIIKN